MTGWIMRWFAAGIHNPEEMTRHVKACACLVALLFLIALVISLFEPGGELSRERLLGRPEEKQEL